MEIIELIHRKNAHTDGDVIVHFKKANIYHIGDIFVTYRLPFIDENNGGDIFAAKPKGVAKTEFRGGPVLHSFFRALTGLARAARTHLKLTVSKAMSMAITPASAKTHQLKLVR